MHVSARTPLPVALAVVALALAASGTLLAVATPLGSSVADVLFGHDGDADDRVIARLDNSNSKLAPDASRVDANVEFPQALSGLPGTPVHLAVDPVSGDLWFVFFSYGRTASGDNTLYRYRESDGTLKVRSIPASGTGSELYSAIAVDSRGHVIFAEGGVVLDIDPAGGYEEHQLPAEPLNLMPQQGFLGGYVTDMVLSANGKAYLTRRYVAAVTELDLRTGSLKEIPIPASMFLVRNIDLAGDRLWMTAPSSTADTPSQTAVLDLTTGVTESSSFRSFDLVADGQGRVYVSSQKGEGVIAADAIDASMEDAGPWQLTDEARGLLNSVSAESAGTTWAPALLAADSARGRIWMAGGGAIGSLEPATNTTEFYRLPSWAASELQPIHVPIGCQTDRDLCPEPRGAHTQIGGIAVAPNGDVFFSDTSKHRIGIVHPR
ncbi:MAG: hypothetical protein IH957_04335 [Chloroflexi bacterium]|nr:hypothetical protein [Chloroflexota bacterium]